jgi:hypothetical protein
MLFAVRGKQPQLNKFAEGPPLFGMRSCLGALDCTHPPLLCKTPPMKSANSRESLPAAILPYSGPYRWWGTSTLHMITVSIACPAFGIHLTASVYAS